jgi:hypothetical protein
MICPTVGELAPPPPPGIDRKSRRSLARPSPWPRPRPSARPRAVARPRRAPGAQACTTSLRSPLIGPKPPIITVAWLVAREGGHTWPGRYQFASLIRVGMTPPDIDATEVIWEHLKRYPAGGVGRLQNASAVGAHRFRTYGVAAEDQRLPRPGRGRPAPCRLPSRDAHPILLFETLSSSIRGDSVDVGIRIPSGSLTSKPLRARTAPA